VSDACKERKYRNPQARNARTCGIGAQGRTARDRPRGAGFGRGWTRGSHRGGSAYGGGARRARFAAQRRSDEMAAAAIREALRRAAPLDPLRSMMCYRLRLPEGNRPEHRAPGCIAGGVADRGPATVNRLLLRMQTTLAGAGDPCGLADVIIAAEPIDMMVPMTGNKFSPIPGSPPSGRRSTPTLGAPAPRPLRRPLR
jgi:hypothetical protein